MNRFALYSAIWTMVLATLHSVNGGFMKQRDSKEDKIVNGVAVDAHKYPWTVNVLFFGQFHICGASLISETKVICAAHCFPDDAKPSSYSLVLGDHDHLQQEPGQVTRKIKYVVRHEGFNPKTMDNDLAMVEMDAPVEFSDSIQPIDITFYPVFGGEVLTVMGWGDSKGTMDENILNEASVPVIDHVTCNEWYSGQITENMVCAGYEEGNIDSCQGDSGGPLVRKLQGVYVLQGVVSWGKGCANPKQPGVYTNIYNYREWIYGHMSP